MESILPLCINQSFRFTLAFLNGFADKGDFSHLLF